MKKTTSGIFECKWCTSPCILDVVGGGIPDECPFGKKEVNWARSISEDETPQKEEYKQTLQMHDDQIGILFNFLEGELIKMRAMVREEIEKRLEKVGKE